MQYTFIYKYIGYILLKLIKQHSLATSKNISLWQEIHLPSQQYCLSISFHDNNFKFGTRIGIQHTILNPE